MRLFFLASMGVEKVVVFNKEDCRSFKKILKFEQKIRLI